MRRCAVQAVGTFWGLTVGSFLGLVVATTVGLQVFECLGFVGGLASVFFFCPVGGLVGGYGAYRLLD
jgi:hypothetical protein